MVHPALRLRPALALALLLVAVVACGADATQSSGPGATATATSTPSPAATAGGSCTPAPAATGTPSATDRFSDTVCLLTTADGLRYGDLVSGTGAMPQKGENITVEYTGWLSDGTMFDSSRQSGRTPFQFVIGATPPNVIAGWDEGLLTMRIGGKRRLVIPPQLGYGSAGQGPIPANATLIFEVELLAIGGPSPT